jgi:hypothetical protein
LTKTIEFRRILLEFAWCVNSGVAGRVSHAKAAGHKDGVVGKSEIAVFPVRLCESLWVLLLSHAKAPRRKDGVVGISEIAVLPLRLGAFARAHQSSQMLLLWPISMRGSWDWELAADGGNRHSAG